ncbi:hypothetical protein CGLO_03109 [Colletotrichum gloeosporioides Cg-14]|uniref:Uncharacterized protein n=1 Tax=Colletotrichum gloeosporioides (strain Cg-14) TaxID=1237896 RepID=T0KMI4_COLGC|nr:hypothetical protein CGLO_03109 [Colletotrichum gloeosporioides Cg-14]
MVDFMPLPRSDNYDVNGARYLIHFSLPEDSERWHVKCMNLAALAKDDPDWGWDASDPLPDEKFASIERGLEQLKMDNNIRDDSEDVVLITGFDDAYRARQNANMRVPDLDDDITELLSQFRFIAFFFCEVELLTAVTHYCHGDFEFPGKNFAKLVKRMPQVGHSLQEWVAPGKRQHIIIYFSHKNYEDIPRSTISLFDRYDMDQDPEFLFMSEYAASYDLCASESRARGELLPQLLFGLDDDASDDEDASSSGEYFADPNHDDIPGQ